MHVVSVMLYQFLLFLPPANEVLGKVMFSQASDNLLGEGCVGFPACITVPMTRGSASTGSASEGVEWTSKVCLLEGEGVFGQTPKVHGIL